MAQRPLGVTVARGSLSPSASSAALSGISFSPLFFFPRCIHCGRGLTGPLTLVAIYPDTVCQFRIPLVKNPDALTRWWCQRGHGSLLIRLQCTSAHAAPPPFAVTALGASLQGSAFPDVPLLSPARVLCPLCKPITRRAEALPSLFR